MKIKKRIEGHDIVLEYEKVKRYPQGFTSFKVYKILNDTKKLFLYIVSLSDLEIKEIEKTGYILKEEVFI